jgi:hypothetical protein
MRQGACGKENGERSMESEERRTENGAWRADNGEWSMGHGVWSMEYGVWGMEHGDRREVGSQQAAVGSVVRRSKFCVRCLSGVEGPLGKSVRLRKSENLTGFPQPVRFAQFDATFKLSSFFLLFLFEFFF